MKPPRHAPRCRHRSTLRARLAFRRSTSGTCGSDRTPPLSFSDALPATRYRGAGVTRPLASQSSDHSQTGRNAGRASLPKPPGSEGDEPPPAGTALAPPPGVTVLASLLRERDSHGNVTETVSPVKVT